jgi:hypothetical protein
MRKLLLAAAGAAALTFGTAANATTSITPTEGVKPSDEGGIMTFIASPGADGSIVAQFGHTGILAGDFVDFFLFTIDAIGEGSGSLATSTTLLGFEGATDLDITAVFVNDLLATLDLEDANHVDCAVRGVGTCGTFETWSIAGVPIFFGVQNEIRVEGFSRGNGSFGGNATFVPIPEPGTWAMMLLGFGAVGYAMRRRRRPELLAQAA